MTLVVLANTSWTGLVVENGYVESQRFNQELAEARKQTLLGWTAEFGYRDGRLEVKLRDREGRALRRPSASVKLVRPSTDKEDRMVTLTKSAAGVYSSMIPLSSGVWDADVNSRASSGDGVRHIYRLYVSIRVDP